MKLFVTGGTGFVGSHFLRGAVAAGHHVVALRRHGSLTRVSVPDNVVWIEGDLNSDISAEFVGVDCFVHLAAHSANVPYDSLSECMRWNAYASVSMAEKAAKSGVKNFLIAGTCFEYGLSSIGQVQIHPRSELLPINSYSVSKAAGSIAFLGLCRERNLKMQLLRIFQVYGEGESPHRFWPSLRNAAMNGLDFPMSSGKQIRDFINVTDVAAAFVQALDFKGVQEAVPQIRNIGTGCGSSLLEFARNWWKQFGAKGSLIPCSLPQREGELSRIVADIDSVAVL